MVIGSIARAPAHESKRKADRSSVMAMARNKRREDYDLTPD